MSNRALEKASDKAFYGTRRLPLCSFTLIPGRRDIPVDPDELDGYYQGRVRVTQCPSRPDMVGAIMYAKLWEMFSCAPYFVFTTRHAQWDAQTDSIVVRERQDTRDGAYGPLVTVLSIKERLDRDDVLFLRQEVAERGEWDALFRDSPPRLRTLALTLLEDVKSVETSEAVLRMPWSHRDGGAIFEASQLVRFPVVADVYRYLVPDARDPRQRARLDALPTSAARRLQETLRTQPWELLWDAPIRTEFALKPLTRERYESALRQFRLQDKIPAHIQFATVILFRMQVEQDQFKHTCFERSSFGAVVPAFPNRDAIIASVWDYLYDRGVDALDTEGRWVALRRDAAEARASLVALCRFRDNDAKHGEPELRGPNVAHVPPPLTDRQWEIARHIQGHWFTVVEGLPGTGKTAVLEWVFAHYRATLLTGFVGMLVKMLQRRNGKRADVAHTIHHLLATADWMGDAARRWLAAFQVLVVDEISNVSQKLFSRLLALLPNVRKVVVVGDHRQLKPIGSGDPMGDLIRAFGSQHLTQNLRVMPGLASLQQAPALIAEGKARLVAVATDGPVSFVKPPPAAASGHEALCQTLLPILASICQKPGGKATMNTHVVLLLNSSSDGRVQVNAACEDAWQRLGVIKKPSRGGGVVSVRRGLDLYPGVKVTFLKNYNVPIRVAFSADGTATAAVASQEPSKKRRKKKEAECHSDPVANGELYIVKSVAHYAAPAHGIRLELAETDDKTEKDVGIKIVWIDKKHGVHPSHIDLGYATTTYKTQGREFPHVIFWNRASPGEHWTRPHAYVAVSRAKERLWVVSEPRDFFTVCDQLDVRRRTALGVLLAGAEMGDARCRWAPAGEVVARKDMRVVPKTEPVVPRLVDFVLSPPPAE
jgi:hypothetical protein